MKVSTMLFSLLVACQALPVAMHSAAAQSEAITKADMDDVQRAQFADQFGPERLRNEYNAAAVRSKQFAGKRQAYTYDFVVDTNMALGGGNSMKTQTKLSYAYDKDGRMRNVSSMAGLERSVIADPTTQTVYLVCPERKEVLPLLPPSGLKVTIIAGRNEPSLSELKKSYKGWDVSVLEDGKSFVARKAVA